MDHKKAVSTLTFLMIAIISLSSQNVTTSSGGSIKTELGYGIVVNEKSSLNREWITIHDSNLPIDIVDTVGIKTIYKSSSSYSSGGYRYKTEYEIICREPIAAFEIRFLTFNIWGERVKNLSATVIEDIQPDVKKSYEGIWTLSSENDAEEFFASIAYIAQVRTINGRIYKANPSFVVEQARKYTEKYSESDLELREG